MVAKGEDLTQLPGIGEAIAKKIETVVRSGRLPQLDEVLKRTPKSLIELLEIPGLGPKRVQALFNALKIKSLEDLERAARSGKIKELPGFGAKTEELILKHLQKHELGEKRFLRFAAESVASALLAHLRDCSSLEQLVVAGSFRRWKETVGDLDLLVTVHNGAEVMARFLAYEGIEEILSHGTSRSSIRLKNGLQVDLRVVPKDSFGAALQYFTGSKAHNIQLRTLAVKRGLKINEYGVFQGDKRLAGEYEEEVYAALGLPWIAPELREGQGEIEAALENRLPKLVELSDIRGDLHCHTEETDGQDSLETLAKTAMALGYEYLAITDHSKRLTVAKGLDEKRLRQQMAKIDALNARLPGVRLLKGIEVDILEDGRLDLPDSVLKDLDLVVCSVHYKFNLSEKKQTERILRAMDNPYCHILAHPTGRLINQRDPYPVDLERVMQGAKERGCFLEINSQPERLDLNGEYARMAREIGVKLVISTDAHSAAGLTLMRYGVAQARRGWLTAQEVLNTRSLPELLTCLKRR
jgi:DNA polymerase (family 10)